MPSSSAAAPSTVKEYYIPPNLLKLHQPVRLRDITPYRPGKKGRGRSPADTVKGYYITLNGVGCGVQEKGDKAAARPVQLRVIT